MLPQIHPLKKEGEQRDMVSTPNMSLPTELDVRPRRSLSNKWCFSTRDKEAAQRATAAEGSLGFAFDHQQKEWKQSRRCINMMMEEEQESMR